jgi:hypothetical protein
MRVVLFGLLVIATPLCAGAAEDRKETAVGLSDRMPTAEARRVAERIRHEALLPPHGPAGRPLPLVSHWNMGSQGRGWTPQYQIELLNQGHYILPWLGWPQGEPDKDGEAAARFNDYYAGLLSVCRELRLPICFRGTQW